MPIILYAAGQHRPRGRGRLDEERPKGKFSERLMRLFHGVANQGRWRMRRVAARVARPGPSIEFRFRVEDGNVQAARFRAYGCPVSITYPQALGMTANTWDSEDRSVGTELPGSGPNTMSYRADGLRYRLADSEGDKLMVWDALGSSGYLDLLQE